MKKVTIVIPNYNGKHFMEPCLAALDRQTSKDFEILVVDNASTDGSLEYMSENYPEIRVIPMDKNYGFSSAVNEGIRNTKTPYVLLLNNDTEPEEHFIEEMIKAIEKSPQIFSVSSKMIQLYHKDLIDSAGDLYTVVGWSVRRGYGRSVTNYTHPADIFSACAGAAIYRTRLFKKIGLFDVSHFAYLEDIDVCFRAKIYGYRNVYCPTAKVYHVGSGTSGSNYNSFKVKLSARNNIWLNYKNMPTGMLVVNFLPILMGTIIKYFFFQKMGFGKDYLDGVKEGLEGMKKCKKVPYKSKHLVNYLAIEAELIVNFFSYVIDWTSRETEKKAEEK